MQPHRSEYFRPDAEAGSHVGHGGTVIATYCDEESSRRSLECRRHIH